MGVETAKRSANRSSRSSSMSDNQNAHNRVPTEDELSSLFNEAMHRAPLESTAKSMSQDEQQKFVKAMGDPEFRSLLSDYMKEISDPANRAETEQYLAQLERDQKVPENKMLIKPAPGFVVKTKWNGSEKMFVNICSSEKLQPPSSTKVENRGTSWSLPYSVGPERMEPGKSGQLVVTYDVCFHPRTLQFATMQKPYRDMVVRTCLDAVEPLLRKSQAKPDAVVSRDYHVLKGVLYKSGEPVTMCLSTSAAGVEAEMKNETNLESKLERLEPTAVEPLEEARSTIVHERSSDKKPLIQEVPTCKSGEAKRSASSGEPKKPLPKLEFRIVYRGKFEMMDHMQATLSSHEQPAQLPNRPKELVVEISFPTHSSAKGIDLDVNDKAVKVETAGYAPLEVNLPFPVVEEKGSAKFDKKARKLVVTLPVHPPEVAPVKRMAIVEQDDEGEQEEDAVVRRSAAVHAAMPHAPVAEKRPVAKDDTFAMLRETAMMVANDPLYLQRLATVARTETRESGEKMALPSVSNQNTPSFVANANQHITQDASYDDLPPLESCSEDEDDFELDLEDTLDMEPQVYSTHAAAVADQPVVQTPVKPPADSRIVYQTPTFTTNETASCLSYLIEVASADPGSAQLTFTTPTAFSLRFTADGKSFELVVRHLQAGIDPNRSEINVASENVAIILYKASAGSNLAEEVQPVVQAAAPPPPIARFQNDLLYDID